MTSLGERIGVQRIPRRLRTPGDLTSSPVPSLASAPERAGMPPAAFNGVLIDASEFLHRLPENHRIADAVSLGEPWLFRNFAIEAGTRHNLLARVAVPAAGRYHLHVRSRGGRFRVGVNDRVIDQDLQHDTLALRHVGVFDLPAGVADVRIMGIEGTPIIDVLALSPHERLTDDDLRPHELPAGVDLLRDYAIPVGSTVKFGDLVGDGRMGFVVLGRDFSAYAFDHDGCELWRYEAPAEGAEERVHEPPGLVWDVDGDGRAEFIHWRTIDGEECLVIADGRSGAIRRQVPWPTQPPPHDYSNFRLAIGQLRSGWPDTILVFTDCGVWSQRQGHISIAAYDGELNRLWEHVEPRCKDHLGHYIYPIDLDGRGVDHVMVGGLMLDADGRRLWDRFDFLFRNQEHLDSIRFADLTGDGRVELVAACSDLGLVVLDPRRQGAMVWQRNAEHGQQLEVGDFLDDVEGLQVALGARTYKPLSSQVWWFNRRGDVVGKWPANRVAGNPVFVTGDWDGDGRPELFWHRFRLGRDGRGELHFPEQVYHMFDFTGRGVDEMITLADGVLRVYGCRDAQTAPAKRDPHYLKTRVANHTHY